ncbi:MAG: aminotransferase class I/II-fold pyridoxal phosphate-dependent enzyme [Magnetococcales bacterium]|nr:aminotransferase class I/II-fold pyridoxal phosphate-dependent enzyme [Magnetococcales bacterium]
MISKRAQRIRPFHVMEVLDRAKAMIAQGRDVVRLEVGEPTFPTPPAIRKAAQDALEQDSTRYTPALGIPELRQAVASWYKDTYNVSVDPHRVVITTGTSGAFLLLFSLLLDVGESLVVSDPGYPCYTNILESVGAEVVRVPVGPERRYHLDQTAVQSVITDKVRGVLVTSPSNPTGTVIDDDSFAALIRWCERAGRFLISDEIYHGITYGRSATTALSLSDQAIVVNGFSKFFGMTGWRVGWMVVPETLVRPAERLAQNLFISAPTVAQKAALAAFESLDLLQEQVQSFDRNRKVLLPALREMGFGITTEPEGAFYIYADVSDLLEKTGLADAMALSNALLEWAEVAVTPGVDFGQHRADCHLRFSYACRLERVEEGIRRIKRFLSP